MEQGKVVEMPQKEENELPSVPNQETNSIFDIKQDEEYKDAIEQNILLSHQAAKLMNENPAVIREIVKSWHNMYTEATAIGFLPMQAMQLVTASISAVRK